MTRCKNIRIVFLSVVGILGTVACARAARPFANSDMCMQTFGRSLGSCVQRGFGKTEVLMQELTDSLFTMIVLLLA